MEKYIKLLKQYIMTEDEEALYKADQFSKESLQKDFSPDEIVQLHIESLLNLYPDLSKEMRLSLDFLLQTMISYGIAHQEFQVLRERQRELKSEIDVAAKMQKTLLDTSIPKLDDLEVGAISLPAKIMNGDYHHFIQDSDGNVGVAVADIIGKGIPAALCMSMIKYALDSFPDTLVQPDAILKLLNRVVEANIESGMFITMFYGFYDQKSHHFSYSSAGHEPGFFYSAKDGTFEEITAKGIVLGVKKNANYERFTRKLEIGDMIVLLTDGVTECRRGQYFIEREEVIEVLQRYKDLHPEVLVKNVFQHFERLQDFELCDDFTLIVIKRNK